MHEDKKNRRFEEELLHAASEFISREAHKTSLVTVIHIALSEKGTKAVVGVSVLPSSEEENVLLFLRRKRSDFREFLQKRYPSRIIPRIDFIIDMGEKNRARIDALLDTV